MSRLHPTGGSSGLTDLLSRHRCCGGSILSLRGGGLATPRILLRSPGGGEALPLPAGGHLGLWMGASAPPPAQGRDKKWSADPQCVCLGKGLLDRKPSDLGICCEKIPKSKRVNNVTSSIFRGKWSVHQGEILSGNTHFCERLSTLSLCVYVSSLVHPKNNGWGLTFHR